MAQPSMWPKYNNSLLDTLTYGEIIPDTLNPTACLQTSATNARAPCVALEKCFAPVGVEEGKETQCQFLKLQLTNENYWLKKWLCALDNKNLHLLMENGESFLSPSAVCTEGVTARYRMLMRRCGEEVCLRVKIDRQTNVHVWNNTAGRFVPGTQQDLKASWVLPCVEFRRAGKFGMCAPMAVDIFVWQGMWFAASDDEPAAEVALPAPESACEDEEGGGAGAVGAVVSGDTAALHTTGTSRTATDSSSDDDS